MSFEVLILLSFITSLPFVAMFMAGQDLQESLRALSDHLKSY